MLRLSLLALISGSLLGCGGVGSTGNTQQAVGNCPPSPAPVVFQNALCLCGDLAEVGASIATRSASGAAASVGVNGRSDIVGFNDVQGTWTAYGGLSGTGDVRVKKDLLTTGDLTGVGAVDVGGDLSVGGDLTGVGLVSVGGTLRVAGQNTTIGLDQIGASGPYQAPAAPPCDCDGSKFFDVAGAVTAAKAKNDNGAHGLPTSLAAIGVQQVALSTGSYYFDHVETIGLAHFVVDGVVALYLDGSIDAVGAEWIEVKPGATLDLYVSGAVRTVGALGLGSDPSSVRLYVGGKDAAVLSVGLEELSASIYAPTAQVAFVGATLIHGSLFAHDLDGVGLFAIDYAAPQAPTPGQCGAPGGGSAGNNNGNNGGSNSGNGGGATGGGTPSGQTGTPPVQ
jgi:hypothetical protein